MEFFSTLIGDVVEFCSTQCKLQGVSATFVEHMFRAYDYLLGFTRGGNATVSPELILHLGVLVNPGVNHPDHFRGGPVAFTEHDDVILNWRNVPRLIEQLCAVQADMTADDFYWEFERIHPFFDGNGRVGAMLWNQRRGSLMTPIQPPEMTWT